MSKPMDDDEDDLGGGSGEFGKYHHMGPSKKSRSMYRRESFLFETFLRISIQIIWIALGRKSFNEIEFEVHRIFKSNLYNSAEHRLTSDNKRPEMTPNERQVLLGHCLHVKHKVDTLSPLMNEVHCSKRNIDYRMYGLGIVKYPRLSSRLAYMEYALSLPEKLLQQQNVALGILGMPRSRFDILLREITGETDSSSSNLNKCVLCLK
ncbi:hypothetical protein HF086_015086 [Spodoptera exigua]|uniref:Uncharacterized protein n=1 Tax=Spodoptera exigua TaxID=7107 RepID=A0A922MPB0_SPOEX|nr:hypothetical protein HF086_015086 [Spodoptera exigua]